MIIYFELYPHHGEKNIILSDIYLWHFYLTFIFDIYIWHSSLTFISDTYLWPLYLTLTFINDIYIWRLYLILQLIFDISVWHLYLTFISGIHLWHLYLTFIFDLYIWHLWGRAGHRREERRVEVRSGRCLSSSPPPWPSPLSPSSWSVSSSSTACILVQNMCSPYVKSFGNTEWHLNLTLAPDISRCLLRKVVHYRFQTAWTFSVILIWNEELVLGARFQTNPTA